MTTWVEVRGAALTANVQAVRALIGPAVRLCAVVKGNGYGHGAVLAARAFLAGGADLLAVTTVAEAVELREAGLDAPVLLLASHAPDEADDVVAHDLTATVSSLSAATHLGAAAARQGRPVAVHLLVDVGMGRDGCLPAEAPELWQRLQAVEGLRAEGLFCHFPTSIAPDLGPTRAQLQRFQQQVAACDPPPPCVHAANSGATLRLPESRFGLVRVGTVLYGQLPSAHVPRALDLQSGWALKSRLVEVRRLPAGATIGYGSEVTLRSERLVGTLLVGWQQGFGLAPESLTKGLRGLRALLRRQPPTVMVRGVRCPVLGRIAMQSCAVDVTGVPGVEVGDVADVPARRVTIDRAVPRVLVD